MAKTVKDNGLYFILLAVFILVGGIYLSQSEKTDAIYFFSEHRTPLLNSAFKFITRLGEGPMYFIIGILALVVKIRYSLLVAITGLSVMLTSFTLKTFFAVERPKVFFAKQNLLEKLNLIEGIDLHVGNTSFPSGHAMSAFALYSLLVFILPSKNRYALALFFVACLVGISRVYLIQHFWPDVYVGSIIGVVLTMLIYVFQARLNMGWLDKPLIKISKRTAA